VPTIPSIWTGISGLTALLLVAGASAWYLLLSPLAEPAPHLADSPANRRWRERLVLFYLGSQVILSVGSFWDVAWHMRFGIRLQEPGAGGGPEGRLERSKSCPRAS
jgi:hypothetical protein